MFIARLKDGVAVEYPLKEIDVRKTLADSSLPPKLTNDILEPLGFAIVIEGKVEDFPQVSKTHRAVIDRVYKDEDGLWKRTYKLIPVPASEYESRLNVMWKKVREKRDKLMSDFEWRIARYHRQVSLGMTPVDDINTLHQYMQQLADITNQEDPFQIVYPIEP